MLVARTFEKNLRFEKKLADELMGPGYRLTKTLLILRSL